MRDKRVHVAVAVLWALVIFVLCSLPGEAIPNPRLDIPHLDKAVHGGMFFVMSLLIILLCESHTSLTTGRIHVVAVSVAFAYGGLMEILQHYFFHRSGDVWDLSADVAGGIVGCLCYPMIRRILRIKN